MRVEVPPQSLEAEQNVLGACLVDQEAAAKVAPLLTPDDFYSAKHADLWRAITDLHARREPVDATTVLTALRAANTLDSIGGGPYLAMLMNAVAVTANVEAYARTVAECSIRRRIVRDARQIGEQARDMAQPLSDVLQTGARTATEWQGIHSSAGGLTTPADAMDWLEALEKQDERVRATQTGLVVFDRVCPLAAGTLTILAARPSMGKTATGLRLAVGAAKNKFSAAFFSLEMSREQLYPRLIAPETGLNIQDVEFGRLNDEGWSLAYNAAARLATLPLYIDYSSRHTSLSIYSECAKLKARRGELGLVVIDYIGFLRDKQGRDQRRDQLVGEMARNLKTLSKELCVPVVLLSQLSRQVEGRNDKRPQLSDLRESGELEQDADRVVFPYRPDYYDPAAHPGLMQFLVAKNRNGPVTDLWLTFNRGTGRIEEIPPNRWPS